MEESINTDTLVKQNRRLKTSLIILSVVLVISLGLLAVICSFNQSPVEEEISDDTNSETIENSIELNLGSDVVLNDMSYISSISISEGDQEFNIASGIVRIKKDVAQSTILSMDIINKYDIEALYMDKFDDVYDNILNDNMDAQFLKTGSNPSFATSISPAVYDPLVKINVDYPNTDHTFALLSLSNGQEFAQADGSSPNFEIFVFATKNENIIRLQSNRDNLIDHILLTEEESESCTEVDEVYGDIYNVDCLKDIYNSGKYDKTLQDNAEELIGWFELKI
ncbi:TPA: hypothetical protein DEP90_01470 [Patescibacteria group bacterium]|nr:hypothetical protein [Patescibacteria group bacterium]